MERIEFALEGRPYIELIRLLKAVGIVPSGGAAKVAVESALVRLDGVVEHRKRAKVRPGMVVEYLEFRIEVQA
ncbi:MAG: RNA-binding protein [Bacteroidia bacterium]|nr:MAG: RNA-binding protein [Bacteroidia bacterium]